MNIFLQNFIEYFEQVINPAGSSASENGKGKMKSAKENFARTASPESINIRGGLLKKQEKIRRNPAP